MSGVVDRNGQQWEHCCECHGFVKFQHLVYEKPGTVKNPDGTAKFRYGRDLCKPCGKASKLIYGWK